MCVKLPLQAKSFPRLEGSSNRGVKQEHVPEHLMYDLSDLSYLISHIDRFFDLEPGGWNGGLVLLVQNQVGGFGGVRNGDNGK